MTFYVNNVIILNESRIRIYSLSTDFEHNERWYYMTLSGETQQKGKIVRFPAEHGKSYGSIEFPKGKFNALTRGQLKTNIATLKNIGASREQVIEGFKQFVDNPLIKWNTPDSKKDYLSDVEYVWNTI